MIGRLTSVSLLTAACSLAQNSYLPATISTASPTETAAWQVLDKDLSHSDGDHRRQAIAAVASIGATPETLKIVESKLQDKDVLVRQTAAAELGEMNSTEAIPYLKQALGDTDEVSFTAAESLWKLGDKSGNIVFEEVLEGERSNAPGMVTGKLRDARKKMHDPAALALMGAKEATGALLGPASMGIVVAQEALKDKGSSGRVLAARYLGEDPDPYALTLLEWALGDKNWAVRAAVAKALGERGNAGTIAKLEPLLRDSHPAVACMAAASIIRLSSSTPERGPA